MKPTERCGGEKRFRNNLNDLSPKEWIKFQKSWFVHNPPRRRKEVLLHPAKFPETLVQEFIEFFTKRGQVVLDPMVGTGSTLMAALCAHRHSYGIELNPKYASIASQIVKQERAKLGTSVGHLVAEVIVGDAAKMPEYVEQYKIPPIDYVITSPPYWNMLHAQGSYTQRKRRSDAGLDVYYSDADEDLGNIADYKTFIEKLGQIFKGLKPYLRRGAYLTIIVKNIKKGKRMYPLAWDIARYLDGTYLLKDEKIWCQDNQRLSPFGMGKAWVSNTFHHYCLQFWNE